MSDKKLVYDILETERADDGGFIPVIVTEGETGYNKTDWNWGSDREIAQGLCDKRNRGMGITKREAVIICLKSMAAPGFFRDTPSVDIIGTAPMFADVERIEIVPDGEYLGQEESKAVGIGDHPRSSVLAGEQFRRTLYAGPVADVIDWVSRNTPEGMAIEDRDDDPAQLIKWSRGY